MRQSLAVEFVATSLLQFLISRTLVYISHVQAFHIQSYCYCFDVLQ